MSSAFVKASTIPDVEGNHALVKVLMDYYETPGSYALNLGQPALIFKQLDIVIAWAQGKIKGGQVSQSDTLQRVAIFFVQRACLRQEGTHYDVMGLGREFSLDALRLRYRALISLTHPDKGVQGLPTDAAVRINKAYEALRDSAIRAHYDSSISVESLTKLRSIERPSSTYSLGKLGWINRLQAYGPNVRKAVIFAMPISVVLLIVVMTVSQNPSDLQLVEKSSAYEKSSSSFSSPMGSKASVPAASVYADLNESGRQLLLQNKVTESLVPLDRKVNVHSERSSTRLKNKEEFTQAAVLAPREVIQNSNIPDTDPAKSVTTTVAAADFSNQLSLKVSTSIPVMTESKRLYAQLNEARFLATQLISVLERPKDAEALQNKMMKQGVSGNLFGLALPHLRQSAAVRIDQLVLKEKLDNNHLILNGSVALWLGVTTNQLMPYKYAVNVEFKNIENGPVMSSFDLKEAR